MTYFTFYTHLWLSFVESNSLEEIRIDVVRQAALEQVFVSLGEIHMWFYLELQFALFHCVSLSQN
jgi:hypothetical protein